eukprot:1147432-Pelagomonas_calceolata.AAC.3
MSALQQGADIAIQVRYCFHAVVLHALNPQDAICDDADRMKTEDEDRMPAMDPCAWMLMLVLGWSTGVDMEAGCLPWLGCLCLDDQQLT